MAPKNFTEAKPATTSAGNSTGKSDLVKKSKAAPGPSGKQSKSNNKRKDAPGQDADPRQQGKGPQSNTRATKRAKTREVRSIATQKPHAAVKDGELNVQSFISSMHFQMNALDESMRRTKTSQSTRAFQRVPFKLRRRAAAHNHKRVPTRLQKRAKREMAEDNTPTVNSKTRKPKTTKGRLRAETARRLGVLAKRKRLLKLKKGLGGDTETISVRAARPKIRRNELNEPPVTAPKYRKRQFKKTWLPTHLWHAKRARMTAPTQPLWGFALPLSPTQKLYRPTHRAQWEKGAMAWDTSYMSTVGLHGSSNSVRNVLKALGLTQEALWNDKAKRWRAGAVHWNGMLSRKTQSALHTIGPATIIWNPEELSLSESDNPTSRPRQVIIRIHPSAFLETFNELLRLVKMQHPRPYIQDLRYEIGSIEVTGPESTEALLGILRPYHSGSKSKEGHVSKFESLAGLKDPASLPSGSLMGFTVMDPRLRYPPRQTSLPDTADQGAQIALLESLSSFRNDEGLKAYQLFNRDARFKGSRLPSQQSLNRRRGKGAPGTVLDPTKVDPPIPIILVASRNPTGPQAPGTWTVMLPWKCVLPIWYSLMHYPLSTGGNPWFGGLSEIRQLTSERGRPWFPGDFPGTNAGKTFEMAQRQERKGVWDRIPKGKRINWETLDLGAGRRGEVGIGWNCDYELLFGLNTTGDAEQIPTETKEIAGGAQTADSAKNDRSPFGHLASITLIPQSAFKGYSAPRSDPLPYTTLVTAKINMLARGVPSSCARIYRLPNPKPKVVPSQAEVPATEPPNPKAHGKLPSNLRDQWLAQKPPTTKSKRNSSRDILDLEARTQFLAQQLIAPAGTYPPASPTSETMDGHPLCPDEEDLIGFITTGSFNLRDGRGDGVGSLSAPKALDEVKRYKNPDDAAARLCVVRNAGQSIGWLARWELI